MCAAKDRLPSSLKPLEEAKSRRSIETRSIETGAWWGYRQTPVAIPVKGDLW